MNLRIRYSTDKGKTWSGWTDATLDLAIRVALLPGHRIETEDADITAKIIRHVAHQCSSGDGRRVPRGSAYDALCTACDPPERALEDVEGDVIESLDINNDAGGGRHCNFGEARITMDDGRQLVIRSSGDYDGNSTLYATLYDANGTYHSGSKE
jgi:hypothetical protein